MNKNIKDDAKFQYMKLSKYKLIEYIKENNNTGKEIKGLNSKKKEDLIDLIFKLNVKLHPVPYFEKFQNTKTKSSVNFKTRYGLNPYTKEELLKMDFSKDNFLNPYEGTQHILNPTSDIMKLEDHQKKFLNGFLIGNLRGAIVFHGVGTGKTLTAVACSRMYLQLYPKNSVYVITPSAVIYNFTKEMIAFGLDPRDPRYKYYTYEKFSRSKNVKAENSLLIVDEAHNFRTEMKFDDKNLTYTKNIRGSQLLLRGGIPCHKALLLTATPFVNKPYDIENLLSIAEGRMPNDEESFGVIASSSGMRYDYFKYRISKYDKELSSVYFPKKIEQFIPLITKDDKIRAKTGRDNPYYIYSRQSGVDKLKFDYVLNIITKNKNYKYVCYTTFQESGILALKELLIEEDIPFGIISGMQNARQKADFIDGYNNYENENYLGNKYRILLITKAGAEGVDLKRTRGIFILDGQWNEALYEQIVARAIRFKSHFDLPKSEQVVHVYKLFVCFDWEAEILKKVDENVKIDFLAILEKILAAREAEKKLKKYRDNTGSKRDEYKFNNDLINKYKGIDDFDPEELKKLKKGSAERKKYLEQNQQFAKNKEQYVTQEVKNLSMATPSTDFYMFIKQKVKQFIIDKFISTLIKIPKVEQSVYDFPDVKKIFDKVITDKMTGKQMMEYISKLLKGQILKSKKLLGELDSEKLRKYLDDYIVKTQRAKEKLSVKRGQEYFTPPHVIKEMFNFADLNHAIKSLKNNIIFDCLEPSAGHGAIVHGIMENFDKLHAKYNIDMVEYSEENRKVLKEVQITDFLELKETKDFLEFFPSKQYDFVFMNPPFHLDTKFNKQYKQDVYDYDFVKRAYACLKVNGSIVAITGLKWKENDDIKKWYKSKGAIIEDKTFNWSGEGLKKGADIKSLKVSFIKITKLKEDPEEDKNILDISFKNIILSEKKKEQIAEITNNFEKLVSMEEEPKSATNTKKEEPANEIKKKPKLIWDESRGSYIYDNGKFELKRRRETPKEDPFFEM